MATNADQDPRLDLARKYLLGCERRGEIVPGAANRIGDDIDYLPGGPIEVLRAVHDGLWGEPGATRPEAARAAVFLNPESDRGQEMPVRAILARLSAGGYIKSGSVEQLAREWAADMATLRPGTVVDRVARRLAGRENRGHLAKAPAVPHLEAKARRALALFADDLAPGAVEELAPKFVALAGRHSGGMLNRAIADQIGQDHHSPHWRGGVKPQIDPTWPIFKQDYVDAGVQPAREAARADREARNGPAPPSGAGPGFQLSGRAVPAPPAEEPSAKDRMRAEARASGRYSG